MRGGVFRGEKHDWLFGAVVENAEILLFESADEASIVGHHAHVELNDFGSYADWLLGVRRKRLGLRGLEGAT